MGCSRLSLRGYSLTVLSKLPVWDILNEIIHGYLILFFRSFHPRHFYQSIYRTYLFRFILSLSLSLELVDKHKGKHIFFENHIDLIAHITTVLWLTMR